MNVVFMLGGCSLVLWSWINAMDFLFGDKKPRARSIVLAFACFAVGSATCAYEIVRGLP